MLFKEIEATELVDKGVVGLPVTPELEAAEMQRKFDEIALDVIIPKINEVIKILNESMTTAVVDDDEKIPTSGAIVDYVKLLGGGDMMKTEYDTNNDGVVDKADNATNADNASVAEDANKLGGVSADGYLQTEAVIGTYSDLMANTVAGYTPDALAVKEGLEQVNNNLNMRWNPETDMVEVYSNGEWVESIISAGVSRFYVFKNGSGMQHNIVATFDSSTTGNVTDNVIELINAANTWRTVTFDFDCSAFIGKGKKLYVDLLLGGTPTEQDRIGFSSSSNSWAVGTDSVQRLTGLLDANVRKTVEIDIDSIADSTYKYITMTTYQKQTIIYNMYIK